MGKARNDGVVDFNHKLLPIDGDDLGVSGPSQIETGASWRPLSGAKPGQGLEHAFHPNPREGDHA